MISHEDAHSTNLVCLVPAGGLGTRLSNLTFDRAKPSIAISYDHEGNVTRMIDIPLTAIREAGGIAIVSTLYKPESLEFVNAYSGIKTVHEEAPGSPIDTLRDQVALLEESSATTVGVIPGDAWIEASLIEKMRNTLERSGAIATILGTRELSGHNHRSVDRHNFVVSAENGSDIVSDLGIHLMRKDWLLSHLRNALHADTPRKSLDIWQDIYHIDKPIDPVIMHLSEESPDWVDMGTPANYYRAVHTLNITRADKSNNILFPHATINATSSNVVALPSSNSLPFTLQRAIVPEGVIMYNQADALAG